MTTLLETTLPGLTEYLAKAYPDIKWIIMSEETGKWLVHPRVRRILASGDSWAERRAALIREIREYFGEIYNHDNQPTLPEDTSDIQMLNLARGHSRHNIPQEFQVNAAINEHFYPVKEGEDFGAQHRKDARLRESEDLTTVENDEARAARAASDEALRLAHQQQLDRNEPPQIEFSEQEEVKEGGREGAPEGDADEEYERKHADPTEMRFQQAVRALRQRAVLEDMGRSADELDAANALLLGETTPMEHAGRMAVGAAREVAGRVAPAMMRDAVGRIRAPRGARPANAGDLVAVGASVAAIGMDQAYRHISRQISDYFNQPEPTPVPTTTHVNQVTPTHHHNANSAAAALKTTMPHRHTTSLISADGEVGNYRLPAFGRYNYVTWNRYATGNALQSLQG